jgi:hypothetical protein
MTHLRRWALLTLHCAELKLMGEVDFMDWMDEVCSCMARKCPTEAFVLNLIRHSATTTHARATAARTWGPVRSMPSYFHGVPSALCVSLTLGLCTPDRVRTINVTMTHVFRRGLNNDARLRRWALLTLHCAQLKLMDEIDFYGLGGRSLLLHGAKMPELMRLTFSRPVGTRVDLPC